MQRESCVKNFLERKNYSVNDKAQKIIEICDNWYANRVIEDFHKRKTIQGERYELNRLGFAKRCCSDDANLCEVVEINAGKDNKQCENVNKILEDNRFNTQYRRQLEKVSADGTSGCYIRLDNATIMDDCTVKDGIIRINYVDADCYIPLTVENGEVIEAAFSSSSIEKGKKKTSLVIFTRDEEKRYIAETHIFDEHGEEKKEEEIAVTLGEVKPFAIMRNAEVNNIDDMDGYGLPKILNAIPILKGLDLSYNVLFSDLSKAEKILLINEALCEIDDKTGKPKFTPEQKKVFLLLGEKLPEEKSIIQEYNPTIRIGEITDTIKLFLSLLSMMFGYGTKKYDFESGQITTATEFVLSRQDAMQELNRQRQEAKEYIQGICKAVMWFSNTFKGTAYNIDEEILIDFDDSLITDKDAELEKMRNDALSFDVPKLLVWYLMDAYSISESEAQSLIPDMQEKEPEDDIE